MGGGDDLGEVEGGGDDLGGGGSDEDLGGGGGEDFGGDVEMEGMARIAYLNSKVYVKTRHGVKETTDDIRTEKLTSDIIAGDISAWSSSGRLIR